MTSAAAEPASQGRGDLARMLRAKRVAVIGASERNPFSAPVIRNLRNFGFPGEVLLINPRGEPVNGQPTLRRPSEIDGPVDAAFVCVPSATVLDVIEEAAEAGVTGFVIVSSGFAETGAEGAAKQQQIADLARRRNIALYGPNALGFINYVDRVPLSVVERHNDVGHFGIASVSGSVGAYLAKAADHQQLGLSHLVLAGNEAHTTIADTVDFLVDDPDTRAIGVFLEAVYDPERFASAAERALQAAKPIIVLKAGAAENTARLAAAHTGALVGDDRVFDAVARELGVVRVYSYEDMISTAAMLQATGPIRASGIAAITLSGGSGELLSDIGGLAGVPFPPFSPDTRAALDAMVSAFGQTHNPLDLTGAVLADPGLWERVIGAIAQDPAIGLALCLWDAPGENQPEWAVETLRSIVRGYAGFDRVPPLIGPAAEPTPPAAMKELTDVGIPGVVAGLQTAVAALSGLVAWSERIRDRRPVSVFMAAPAASSGDRPGDERALLDRLANLGVPATPGWRAGDADAAIQAARGFGYPVALKLASPDVQHKSEVGGVRIGLGDESAVREAFAAIRAACPANARFEGAIVSPMRSDFVELIVAVTRDPTWGPVLSVGLGGIWVEIFRDNVLLPLTTDTSRIVEALGRLKAAPLLRGARGRAPVDLEMLAGAIAKIAEAALALGPALDTLELNPVAVWSDRAEAMDALAIWADA